MILLTKTINNKGYIISDKNGLNKMKMESDSLCQSGAQTSR